MVFLTTQLAHAVVTRHGFILNSMPKDPFVYRNWIETKDGPVYLLFKGIFVLQLLKEPAM